MDKLAEDIKNSPLFLKLKNVVENNAYHNNETVYDHLLKTHNIACEQIKGDFINNGDAKKRFLEYLEEDLNGVKIKDLLVLTALVHDIGKILYYKDGDVEKQLKHEGANGITRMPGHEYWGSTLIQELLKDTNLSEINIKRIANVVRLHDTFSEGYFKGNTDWSIDDIVDDVKARAEGLYIEALFNIYCDNFSAEVFGTGKKKIEEIFSSLSLYFPRKYYTK